MSRTDIDDIADVAAAESEAVRRDLRQTLLSGLALTVPFFVTLLVLVWVLGFVANAPSPLVGLIVALGPGEGVSARVVELVTAALVFGLVLAASFAAQHGPDRNLADRIDVLMEDLPGIGSVYTGVERMSDVMVEGDTDSSHEVEIVEFPTETASRSPSSPPTRRRPSIGRPTTRTCRPSSSRWGRTRSWAAT